MDGEGVGDDNGGGDLRRWRRRGGSRSKKEGAGADRQQAGIELYTRACDRRDHPSCACAAGGAPIRKEQRRVVGERAKERTELRRDV